MHLASLLKGRCSLTALGLAWNSISMGGAVQLCDSLAVNSVHTLTTMGRHTQSYRQAGASHALLSIADSSGLAHAHLGFLVPLVCVSQSLRTLDLAFNSLGNSLTADAVTALGKALAANTWVRTQQEIFAVVGAPYIILYYIIEDGRGFG